MTAPRDGGLDVPLGPVRASAADRRRARLVFVAVIAVVLVAIGMAAWARPDPDRLAFTQPSVGPSQARSGAATASPPAPTSRRSEGFPALENKPLAGAPVPVLVQRAGDVAEALAWTTGEERLRTVARFPEAFAGLDDRGHLVVPSPDARSLLIVSLASPVLQSRDRARLVTVDGGRAWGAVGVTGLGGVAWSADSRMLAVGGAPGRWWLVTVDAAGGATGREITIEGGTGRSPEPPTGSSPEPATSQPPTLLDVRLVPVGFSADGRWLYGARVAFGLGTVEPAIRVATSDNVIEPIEAFPWTGPDRLDRREFGIVDRVSGRSIGFGPNASIPGGPPAIEVKDRDGTIAFRVQAGVVLGVLWTDAGDLLLVDADGVPFPSGVRVRRFDSAGKVAATYLETGPVSGGWLIGAADGFAVLALTTDRPERAVQLVVIRLADGATSAIAMPLGEGLLGTGLLR